MPRLQVKREEGDLERPQCSGKLACGRQGWQRRCQKNTSLSDCRLAGAQLVHVRLVRWEDLVYGLLAAIYTDAYRMTAGTARAASTNIKLTRVASTTGCSFLSVLLTSISLNSDT